MAHMSNRERIARAAEEARASAAEKADKVAKKATQKPSVSRPKRTVEPVRMKVIWEVCSATGKTVKTFPYPDKAEAEAATQALSKSTGHTHILRGTKVPME